MKDTFIPNKRPNGFTKWALNLLSNRFVDRAVEMPDILKYNMIKDIKTIQSILESMPSNRRQISKS